MGPSLHDLLEIENDPAFLEFSCAETGYLLWPLARQQFLRQLISDLYYKHAPLLAPVGAVPARQTLMALPKALLHNRRLGGLHGDVLVLGTGAGNFLRDGRWFNRITDYLALASPPDTVSIEGVVDGHVPEPRWNERLGYWLPWQVAITLAGRVSLRDRHVASAEAMLGHARHRAEALLGLHISDRFMQMLTGLVARKIARLPLMSEAYRRMLETVRPRLVLLEEGCYGDRGVFNHVAREMGVRVAEIQHGMVSAGHDAYCYASLLCESESYRRYLPHDFLGYGRWWNEQINVPVNKWVIGNPHYSEQRRVLGEPRRGAEEDILILGDGIEFPLYLALADELSRLIGNRYRVVLRPHPLERERVNKDYPDGRAGAVVIDRHRDIYQSFASAYAVAGEVSTGLFEAIGVATKVLLWETPKARFSYPRHPFATFVDAKTFAEAILAPATGQPVAISHDIWASDWRGNYHRYLEHVLQGAPL
jgi:hypothetical protein